jgi:quercetin dioxygenase-like cupin family protein
MQTIETSREGARSHPKPEWFSGPVFVQTLNEGATATEIEILAVFFDPGARTIPHTHATDQLLHFIEGEGIVATETDRRIYRAGGMAVIPAGEWHWHGATPASSTCHLSIRPGGPSVWAPEVPMRDWDTYIAGALESR